MSQFRNQPFSQRFHRMGDDAEGAYEMAFPKAQRFGWQKIRFYMGNMTDEMKHVPDYFDPSSGTLVECVGLGRDGVLKFRATKWGALKFWRKAAKDLAIFVWNSAERSWALVPYPAFAALITRSIDIYGVQAFEEDGNEYHPIDWEWIEMAAARTGELHAEA